MKNVISTRRDKICDNPRCKKTFRKKKRENYYGEYEGESGDCCSSNCLKSWFKFIMVEYVKVVGMEEGECFFCGASMVGKESLGYIENFMSYGYICSEKCLKDWIEDEELSENEMQNV
ncbi:MAG: hypothetical protein ACTSRU_12990 [Candidatus Hodarchaeales archaeon]